jgi:hypothetical protein
VTIIPKKAAQSADCMAFSAPTTAAFKPSHVTTST